MLTRWLVFLLFRPQLYRVPRDLQTLTEEVMADFLTLDKLRELCVERSLPKQGNHGKLVAQLLHWKKDPNKLLEGWTEKALMGKYTRDELVELCDDRFIRSTGSKQTLLDRLIVWKRGPIVDGSIESLEGWSAEQLMERCTGEEVNELVDSCGRSDIEMKWTKLKKVKALLEPPPSSESESEEDEDNDEDEEEQEVEDEQNDEEGALVAEDMPRDDDDDDDHNDTHSSASSKKQSYTPRPSTPIESKRARESPQWKSVWQYLQSEGWTWEKGRGLVSYYYCKPGYAYRPHGDQKKGTLNVTMFDNEDNLMASLDAETLAIAMCTPNTRNVWKEELLKEEKRRWGKWWDVMKSRGWRWKPGSLLVDYIYFKPDSDGNIPSKKDLVRGVNLFHSMEEVMSTLTPEDKAALDEAAGYNLDDGEGSDESGNEGYHADNFGDANDNDYFSDFDNSLNSNSVLLGSPSIGGERSRSHLAEGARHLQYAGAGSELENHKKRLRSDSFSKNSNYSMLKRKLPGSSAKKRRRRFDVTQINLDQPWRDIWKILSTGGWTWIISGNNSTPHFLRPGTVFSRAKLGVDIFASKDDVLSHIYFEKKNKDASRDSGKTSQIKSPMVQMSRSSRKRRRDALAAEAEAAARAQLMSSYDGNDDANNLDTNAAEKEDSVSVSSNVDESKNYKDGSTDSHESDSEGGFTELDIDLSDKWKHVWQQLKDYCDWTWCPGDGLVSYYYLKPGVKKGTGVLGRDYFADGEEVMEHLRKKQAEASRREMDSKNVEAAIILQESLGPSPPVSSVASPSSMQLGQSSSRSSIALDINRQKHFDPACHVHLSVDKKSEAFAGYTPSIPIGLGVEPGVDQASLLDRLSDRWPGRRTQISRLMSLVGGASSWALPFMYIYGHTGTGKSSIVQETLRGTKTNHAYINCVTVSSARELFDMILDQLDDNASQQANQTDSSDSRANPNSGGAVDVGNSSAFSATSVTAFVNLLRDQTSTDHATYIVLDGLQYLTGMNALHSGDGGGSCNGGDKNGLVAQFVRLQQICRRNIGVIIIGQSAWSHASLSAGGLEPQSVLFPTYTKQEIIQILANECPSAPDNLVLPSTVSLSNVFRIFLEQIHSLYHDVVNDLRQFRYLARRLFPLYISPATRSRSDSSYIPANDASRLQMRMENVYRYMRTRIFQNDVTETELSRLIENCSDSLPNEDLTRQTGTSLPTPGTQRGSSTDPESMITPPQAPRNVVHGKQHTELPALTKWLLVSAYLSSHNPKDTDIKYFTTTGVGRNKRRRTNNTVRGNSRATKRSAKLDGPKTFEMERLFAVFHSLLALVDEDGGVEKATTAATADLGSQLSSLVRLNLLTKVGKGSLDTLKLKCNVSKDVIKDISKELNFQVEKYLHV